MLHLHNTELGLSRTGGGEIEIRAAEIRLRHLRLFQLVAEELRHQRLGEIHDVRNVDQTLPRLVRLALEAARTILIGFSRLKNRQIIRNDLNLRVNS